VIALINRRDQYHVGISAIGLRTAPLILTIVTLAAAGDAPVLMLK